MALLKTPEAALGQPAPDFKLLGVDNRYYSLEDCKGKNGLVVLFICNHCPYVKAIVSKMVTDVMELQQAQIGCVAICSNDPADYPEDSFKNMQAIAKEKGFSFPYLIDETQQVAKAYGAVCTPDIFGYNSNLKLQYRGRIGDAKRELVEAMNLIAKTGKGPKDQIPSQGCSIKWRIE